ncbi:hypothetical protein [Pontivivens ytuae]|uniref:Uncharacterized protein n=1 Tax=Pontivivens ytuae TaxID=2789856 RepID=A0A7S9LU35_9RHOB|nr:hypothetical protein [Pontivivens ytuae]QPH55183.1 hypothetical protein I0K15_05435 [Pontivivens ytuae]
MIYAGLDEYLDTAPRPRSAGPVAILFCEDAVEVPSTLSHHAALGFEEIVTVGRAHDGGAEIDGQALSRIEMSVANRAEAAEVLNRLIARFAGRWIYWSFNGEYLFYPYMKSRRIADLTGFMEEERRDHVFTYVVDLYAADLDKAPNGVSRETAHLDGSGYYGFQRWEDGEPLDRQYDIFGGLAWRYEEFVPWERRRIDRVALFKATEGLRIGEDLRLNEPEMNTISCPWHHNVTVAIASFRVAKSLKRNPGSTFEIPTFMWRRSVPFEWTDTQLMELGFMEPGQWF